MCQNCNKANKTNSDNNIFYACLNCNQILCELCKSNHDKNHNIIEDDKKFFICQLHYEIYTSYCFDCKKDICLLCEMNHKGHKFDSFGGMLPDMMKIKVDENTFYSKKEALKNDIRDIINKLYNLINSIDDYFKVYEDIINSYGNGKRNYFLLQNINEINNFKNNFLQDIDKIVNENNIFNSLK